MRAPVPLNDTVMPVPVTPPMAERPSKFSQIPPPLVNFHLQVSAPCRVHFNKKPAEAGLRIRGDERFDLAASFYELFIIKILWICMT